METPDNKIEHIVQMVRQISEKQEKSALSNEEMTMLRGLNETLDKQEEKNAVLTKELVELKESELKHKQLIEDLEDQLINNKSGLGIDYRQSQEYKAITEAIKFGHESPRVSQEYKDLLRSDSENSGGFVVSTEMSNTILQPIIEISPIRQYASTIQISSKNITMPRYLGDIECAFEGEAEEGMETTATFGTQTVTPYRLTTTIPITNDMLINGSFNIESYIMQKANESFARKEATAFTLGNGFKQPQGFLNDPAIVADAFESEAAGAVSGDDLLLLQGQLKQGYNEMLTFNRLTLSYCRTLKGTDGQYLWQPSLNGATASTIAGVPYFINQDMPDIAANSTPIAIADWKRGYQIVDRTGLSIVRDDITRKKQAIVEITLHRYLTGAPVMNEAFKILKCKA